MHTYIDLYASFINSLRPLYMHTVYFGHIHPPFLFSLTPPRSTFHPHPNFISSFLKTNGPSGLPVFLTSTAVPSTHQGSCSSTHQGPRSFPELSVIHNSSCKDRGVLLILQPTLDLVLCVCFCTEAIF